MGDPNHLLELLVGTSSPGDCFMRFHAECSKGNLPEVYANVWLDNMLRECPEPSAEVKAVSAKVRKVLFSEPDEKDQRIALARKALVDTGYFKEDEVSDDIAPRIIEMHSVIEGDRKQCVEDMTEMAAKDQRIAELEDTITNMKAASDTPLACTVKEILRQADRIAELEDRLRIAVSPDRPSRSIYETDAVLRRLGVTGPITSEQRNLMAKEWLDGSECGILSTLRRLEISTASEALDAQGGGA